jgi:hypothetical protein
MAAMAQTRSSKR